jgi:hypothetical protein
MLRAPVLKSSHCIGDPSDRRHTQKIDLYAQRGASMNRKKSIPTFAAAILTVAAAAAILPVATQTASAQAIIVSTPFAFSAGSESYPAGRYELTFVSDWSLSIRNMNGGGKRFFTVRPEENGSHSLRAGSVVFRNSEGRKSLQAVCVPGTDRVEALLQTETVNSKTKRQALGPTTTVASEKLRSQNKL